MCARASLAAVILLSGAGSAAGGAFDSLDIGTDPTFSSPTLFSPPVDEGGGVILPRRLDFDLFDRELGGPALQRTELGAISIYAEAFWTWVSEGALISFFSEGPDPDPADVPAVHQPWLDAGPHETVFTVTDVTGTRIYATWEFDLSEEELNAYFNGTQSNWERKTPPFDEFEWWQEWEKLGSTIGYTFYGESNAILPLSEAALEDINAALAGDGKFSVLIDAPGEVFVFGHGGPDLDAPGRPHLTALGGPLILDDAWPGDFEANGLVDQADLDLVLLYWGQEPPTDQGWNDRPEGIVDQAALDEVLVGWGSSVQTTNSMIPEPSTWMLLGAACLPLGLWGRRAIVTQA